MVYFLVFVNDYTRQKTWPLMLHHPVTLLNGFAIVNNKKYGDIAAV
jgi:hypothetical protein